MGGKFSGEGNQFSNKWTLMLQEGALRIPERLPGTMSKRDAMVFAAWIVRLCDPTRGEDFSQILRQVRGRST